MWSTRNLIERETYVKDILKKTRQSDDVNEQMDSLAKYLVLKSDEIRQRHEVAHLIETSLKEYFPECVSHLFGSSVNGVGFKESDVDIYLDLQKEPSLLKKSGREIGEKIVSILKKIPEITNVEGILGARIPIVRFVHEESDLKCDLSFHNMMSVMNSKFLKMCQQADPRINTLMVVIKFWAEFQELSGSADGTNRNRKMSNYALNLLVIFFLQNEKFLPSVKELHYNTVGEDSCIINGFECGFPRDLSLWKIPLDGFPNEKSVSELLHNFFEFYADFDYEGCIISPYAGVAMVKDPGGGIKIPIKEGKDSRVLERCQGTVVVQDPFQLDSCVTSAYMSTAWRHWCNNASRIASKWMENGKESAAAKSNLDEIFKSLPCEIITQIEQEMLPPLPQKIRAYKYPFEFCFQQAKLFGVKMIWDKISEKYGPNNSGHNARTFTYRLKMGHIFKYGSGKTEKEAKKRAAQEVMVYLSQFYGTLDYLIDFKFRKKVQTFLKIKKRKAKTSEVPEPSLDKAKTNCNYQFDKMPGKVVTSYIISKNAKSEQIKIKKEPTISKRELDQLANIKTDITEKNGQSEKVEFKFDFNISALEEQDHNETDLLDQAINISWVINQCHHPLMTQLSSTL